MIYIEISCKCSYAINTIVFNFLSNVTMWHQNNLRKLNWLSIANPDKALFQYNPLMLRTPLWVLIYHIVDLLAWSYYALPLLWHYSKHSTTVFKKTLWPHFYGWDSTASRLQPLRGGSLLFTIQFPEIPDTQSDAMLIFFCFYWIYYNTQNVSHPSFPCITSQEHILFEILLQVLFFCCSLWNHDMCRRCPIDLKFGKRDG